MFKWRSSIRFGMKDARTPSFYCKILNSQSPLSHTPPFTENVSKLSIALCNFSDARQVMPVSLVTYQLLCHSSCQCLYTCFTNSFCSITVHALMCLQEWKHTFCTKADYGWLSLLLCQQHSKQQEILKQAVEYIIVLPWYSDQSSPLRWSELLSLKQVWL